MASTHARPQRDRTAVPNDSDRPTTAESTAAPRSDRHPRTNATRWRAILLAGATLLAGCASDSSSRSADAGSNAGSVAGAPKDAPASAPTPQSSGAPRGATADSFGETPDDLTIDVTILPGAQLRGRSEAHIARSKYIVFPDGSLHGDRGRTIEVRTRPGRIRTLSRESMADLWLLLGQSGFSELRETGFGGNPELLAPAPTEVLTVLTVHARGATGTFIRRTPAETPDPAVTRVVRSIARLAWATDDPPLETTVQPVRYDLGPDPYARFRGTSTAASPAR